jgi:putative transcriptional regulator
VAGDGRVLGHRKCAGEKALSMKTRLRVLRAEREWSQSDLAERLHVSRQTINAIETGKYDPSLSLAFGIAKLFSRSIEDVFLPDEEPKSK